MLEKTRRKLHMNREYVLAYRKGKIQKMVEEDFEPLNAYLWIHFVGFTDRFQFTSKYFFLTAASIILTLINDGIALYIFIQDLISLKDGINKQKILELAVDAGCLYLRLLVILKRKELICIQKELAKVYSDLLAEKSYVRFKYRLTAVLVIYDTINFTLVFSKNFVHSTPDYFEYLGDDYYFLFIAPPVSTRLYYVYDILRNLNLATDLITVGFCCMCYVLRRILLVFSYNLYSKKRDADFNHVFSEYNKVFDLISTMNAAFHNMLFATITMLLWWMFYFSYLLLFGDEHFTAFAKVTSILLIAVSFLKFMFICLVASSVTKAAAQVNEAVCQLPWNTFHSCNQPLLLKANRDFIGFMLFDSIAIDKSLILSSVGILITYGIMIATFNTQS